MHVRLAAESPGSCRRGLLRVLWQNHSQQERFSSSAAVSSLETAGLQDYRFRIQYYAGFTPKYACIFGVGNEHGCMHPMPHIPKRSSICLQKLKHSRLCTTKCFCGKVAAIKYFVLKESMYPFPSSHLRQAQLPKLLQQGSLCFKHLQDKGRQLLWPPNPSAPRNIRPCSVSHTTIQTALSRTDSCRDLQILQFPLVEFMVTLCNRPFRFFLPLCMVANGYKEIMCDNKGYTFTEINQ